MTIMQYNHSSGNYEAREDGHLIEVDGDVFAETLADAQKEGMTYDQAWEWLISTTSWTGSTPMYGVMIDGVDQDA